MKNGVMRRQEPETIRKRETILFIIKMQKKNADLEDPKTLVNFVLKFFSLRFIFTLY